MVLLTDQDEIAHLMVAAHQGWKHSQPKRSVLFPELFYLNAEGEEGSIMYPVYYFGLNDFLDDLALKLASIGRPV